MILAASLVVRNEYGRYLPLVLQHLRAFCDQITILDDGSTDGTLDWLRLQVDAKVKVVGNPACTFDQHEGRTRQALLDATLERDPTHVLAIDADEFISDGAELRRLIESDPDAASWTLTMTEVWNATAVGLEIRNDGAWGPQDRIQAWRVPDQILRTYKIVDRKLACPPIPIAVIRSRPRKSGLTIYHFGWADPSTRAPRYRRYMSLDGGRFHARSHLESIMYPPERIGLQEAPWPEATWSQQVLRRLVG